MYVNSVGSPISMQLFHHSDAAVVQQPIAAGAAQEWASSLLQLADQPAEEETFFKLLPANEAACR